MASKIYFYKGNQDVLKKDSDNEKELFKQIQDSFSKILDGKNLSFLLGCGASSHYEGAIDVGIPTMLPLAKEFYSTILPEDKHDFLKNELKLDITDKKFATNLENLLATLHSINYFYETTSQTKNDIYKGVNEIIKITKEFLIKACLNHDNHEGKIDAPLLNIYSVFYRKLLFRNSNLPKVNIFTTNYDLYSEITLDELGVYYVNGFSGGVRKYFNPTIFNYALAEKMDLTQSKWSVIDNFLYLYKLHGSLNWIQDDDDLKLFNVREIQDCTFENLVKQEVVMIHPTPLKHNVSLGPPYSDLFREFQRKLMQTNNVLIVIGYSFSDEHINNLIYQAFTIPSFRLIILGDIEHDKFKNLLKLNDPRIWIVGGELEDKSKLHYFKGFVDHVLPDLSNDDLDQKLENTFVELLKKANHE